MWNLLFHMLQNCYFWAKAKQERQGGYIVSRPTRRSGIWKVIGGKHYLWHPGRCPYNNNEPCPHFESYVPQDDLPIWKVPFDFEGFVIKGDPSKEKIKEILGHENDSVPRRTRTS